MRGRGVVVAVVLAVGGIAVLPPAAQAGPAGQAASAQRRARTEFACAHVGLHWKACDGSSHLNVGARQYLCVAVRGSKGHPIEFRAQDANSGAVLGTSRELVVGDPRHCFWRNTRSSRRRVSFAARTADGASVDVFATAYTQSSN